MGSCEHRNVHGHTESVRLVQTDAEVSFSTQQQQDEDADVHEAEPGCRRTQGKCFVFNTGSDDSLYRFIFIVSHARACTET